MCLILYVFLNIKNSQIVSAKIPFSRLTRVMKFSKDVCKSPRALPSVRETSCFNLSACYFAKKLCPFTKVQHEQPNFKPYLDYASTRKTQFPVCHVKNKIRLSSEVAVVPFYNNKRRTGCTTFDCKKVFDLLCEEN